MVRRKRDDNDIQRCDINGISFDSYWGKWRYQKIVDGKQRTICRRHNLEDIIKYKIINEGLSKIVTDDKIYYIENNELIIDNIFKLENIDTLFDTEDKGFDLITYCISDVHCCGPDFMIDTFVSNCENIIADVLKNNPENVRIVFNGDIVVGSGVYRAQADALIVNDTVDQVLITGLFILKTLIEPIADIVGVENIELLFTLGQHDYHRGATLATVLSMLFRTFGFNSKYSGMETIINLSNDSEYYMYITHGYGYAKNAPRTNAFIANTLEKLYALRNVKDVRIDRICHGHSHWLSTNFEHPVGLFWDCTGGFQRNTRYKLGLNSRPIGIIAYDSLCPDKPYTIRPDYEIVVSETFSEDLTGKNMTFVGDWYQKVQDNDKTIGWTHTIWDVVSSMERERQGS